MRMRAFRIDQAVGGFLLRPDARPLAQGGGGIFQCGIYTSPLRRLSNCGAFPVSARDIQRYDCPSYFVVKAEPVRILEPQA